MSLKKQYLKTKTSCKVTFTLSMEVAGTAKHVNLVGEFNNWDTQNLPMKKLKNGDFSVSLELERLKEYQFKYLIDGKEWLNDIEADKVVQNEFQGENSVVVV
jgi:1,4-alpha-glucan branching enzyme